MHNLLNSLVSITSNIAHQPVSYDTPLIAVVDLYDVQRGIEKHFDVSLEPYGFTPRTTLTDIALALSSQVASHP